MRPLDDKRPEYWFPAKSYGWGWGIPSTWQGWVVLLGYIVAQILLVKYVGPDANPALYFAGVVASSLVFIAICWAKGEPPKWRWGRDDDLP